MDIFVACTYKPEPLPGYRGAFHQVEQDYPSVKFTFADDHISSDVILDKIAEEMERSDVCLFDITGWSPNVCLELGIALGADYKIQLLFREDPDQGRRFRFFRRVGSAPHDLPTDIRGHGRINYQDVQSLTNQLKRFVSQQAGTITIEASQRYFRSLCDTLHSIIAKEPGLRAGDLAARLKLETSNIRSQINKLVQEGKIERQGRGTGMRYYDAGTAPADTADESATGDTSAERAGSSIQ